MKLMQSLGYPMLALLCLSIGGLGSGPLLAEDSGSMPPARPLGSAEPPQMSPEDQSKSINVTVTTPPAAKDLSPEEFRNRFVKVESEVQAAKATLVDVQNTVASVNTRVTQMEQDVYNMRKQQDEMLTLLRQQQEQPQQPGYDGNAIASEAEVVQQCPPGVCNASRAYVLAGGQTQYMYPASYEQVGYAPQEQVQYQQEYQEPPPKKRFDWSAAGEFALNVANIVATFAGGSSTSIGPPRGHPGFRAAAPRGGGGGRVAARPSGGGKVSHSRSAPRVSKTPSRPTQNVCRTPTQTRSTPSRSGGVSRPSGSGGSRPSGNSGGSGGSGKTGGLTINNYSSSSSAATNTTAVTSSNANGNTTDVTVE